MGALQMSDDVVLGLILFAALVGYVCGYASAMVVAQARAHRRPK